MYSLQLLTNNGIKYILKEYSSFCTPAFSHKIFMKQKGRKFAPAAPKIMSFFTAWQMRKRHHFWCSWKKFLVLLILTGFYIVQKLTNEIHPLSNYVMWPNVDAGQNPSVNWRMKVDKDKNAPSKIISVPWIVFGFTTKEF